ncbi:MAG: hypothetical protein HY402_05350 [Elusimicrobia bacterium]|nr:hypothetical protein [Elusimicrobiota bacterium]
MEKSKCKRFVLGFFAAFAASAIFCAVPREPGGAAESTTRDKAASKEEFPWDDGPEEIDVSGYPEKQQQNYKVFAKKCSKCHTLARAINSPYALPEEWAPYIEKMRKKKRSGLDATSAGKIVDFLIYDSSIRKKNLIEKKLQEKKGVQKQERVKEKEIQKPKGD